MHQSPRLLYQIVFLGAPAIDFCLEAKNLSVAAVERGRFSDRVACLIQIAANLRLLGGSYQFIDTSLYAANVC